MPNIQDHALATGGYTLAQRPFDALDSLVLTQLVYMWTMSGWTRFRKSATGCSNAARV